MNNFKNGLILVIFSLFTVDSFGQLKFNSDTLYHVAEYRGKLKSPVMGEVWYLSGDFRTDTLLLSKNKIDSDNQRFNFVESGYLVINACFISCGKYTCDYFGSWKETSPGVIEMNLQDDSFTRAFFLKYYFSFEEDETRILLKKIAFEME